MMGLPELSWAANCSFQSKNNFVKTFNEKPCKSMTYITGTRLDMQCKGTLMTMFFKVFAVFPFSFSVN